jgi:phage gp46-like protein
VEILTPLCFFNFWKEKEMLLTNAVYFLLHPDQRWLRQTDIWWLQETKTQRIGGLLWPQ